MQQVANPFAAQGEIRPASPVGNNNQSLLPKRTVKNKLRNFGKSIKRSVSPPAPGNPAAVVQNSTPAFCKLPTSRRTKIINNTKSILTSYGIGENNIMKVSKAVRNLSNSEGNNNSIIRDAKRSEIPNQMSFGGARRKERRSTKRKSNRSTRRKH